MIFLCKNLSLSQNLKQKLNDLIYVINKLRHLDIKLVIPFVDNSSICNLSEERKIEKVFKKSTKNIYINQINYLF